MIESAAPAPEVSRFVTRWRASGAAERANYQLFLAELCDVLQVPRPDPALPDEAGNAYVFEKTVHFANPDGTESLGRIDLYRRGCFVLEAKQGVSLLASPTGPTRQTGPTRPARRGTAVRGTGAWDAAMVAARGQAEQYAKALPSGEGWPPFLVVVDVGHVVELFSDFTGTGKRYLPFPDARTFRIRLADLEHDDVRARLRAVWLDPSSLDPARASVRVTREVAERLATLARSLEEAGHEPHDVASFLMRCVFTMFSEDVDLLPSGSFTRLLEEAREQPDLFPLIAESLWESMKTGGFAPILKHKVLRFNGNLFAERGALPLTAEQLRLLHEAARADWKSVEPAIFGTLLERALDPVERHRLGAHYTPRAYVERLVVPTLVDPLREEWEAAQAAAVTLANQGRLKEARDEVRAFHRRLCAVRVLDPACGSGNFLYVALEHLKRLEGEVLNALHELGEGQMGLDLAGLTVDPHQLLGIEVNPRAAAIADVVLWIGYLQWHFRTRGRVMPPEPVLRVFHNIACRDAVLEWDRTEPVLDEAGNPVTRWDGETTKPHPATGQLVPDETARVPVVRYVNPRKAQWPEADFVVGNPPFIGNWRMRTALGDGYTEALREAHPEVPESADYVLYWWDHAAELTRAGALRRFGLITTNSLRQVFARRVLERHLEAREPLSLVFAIPDHPWVDSADGADVRIAMTVAEAGERPGSVYEVVREDRSEAAVLLSEVWGKIRSNLTCGADVAAAIPLTANDGLSSPGVKLHGAGFIVTPEEARALGLGRIPGLENHIRPYLNGRDLNQRARGVMVIDLFGLTAEQVRECYPEVYQWVHERVQPERRANAGRTKDADGYAELWWLFGKPRPELRKALGGLPRYIATAETSRHRFFVFLDASICPDNKLVAIALGDAYWLGVLSSRVHVVWATAAGGRLGVGNDPVYVKSRCFDPFPFPALGRDGSPSRPQGSGALGESALPDRIRDLAERLDAHRKRQQALHEGLTLTKMYNMLEKLRRAGLAPPQPSPAATGVGASPDLRETGLTAVERAIHEQGLVSVLRELHDELDAAVFEA
ncbi:MAG: DNA methyltransferase, partial [Thermodesulfobacteriota bacterium]